MQVLSPESITADTIIFPGIKKNVGLTVLRLDKIHPIISGNKWFKLKYYLEDAKTNGQDHIITFGGAYSNHIVATAAAGEMIGFKTTGIIRGEQPAKLSYTLQQAMKYGMQLAFTDREDFRKKELPIDITPNTCIINEGGYGTTGARGAAEILNYCRKENYTHICCAVGTSTMMAGLVQSCTPDQQVIGISVMKNNPALENELLQLLSKKDRQKKFRIIHDYHFGGYAKHTPELIDFMNQLYLHTGIPTDFVYTAKLFYGVMDLINNDLIPEQSHVLIIHSGGLQGNLSLGNGKLSW